MNFYQQANLTMGLSVIFGIQLAISSWLEKTTSLEYKNYSYEMAWIGFQFLLRMKMIIDGHHNFRGDVDSFFKKPGILVFDFVLFILTTLMYILAAIFSFKIQASMGFVISGMVISILRLGVHDITKHSNSHWHYLNIGYIFIMLSIIFDWLSVGIWLKYLALYILLVADFIISKTKDHMPPRSP